MNLIDDLNWRYACKIMNGETVSDDKLDTILESIRLAPTSMGMQMFKVFALKDRAIIDKITKEAASAQHMIPGCSVLLVFAAYTEMNQAIIDEFIDRMGKTRDITGEHLEQYRARWSEAILGLSGQDLINWTSKQTYIAMAYATVAAANLRVDSTPVEGFDSSKVDEILNLNQQNLTSTLLLPLGYRDIETDRLANQPKVRKETKDLFVF